ncbi:MAG: hypothetical protein ACPGU9_00220 [Flavobacteriaceae bacterium]
MKLSILNSKIALGYFLLIAALGVILRFFPILPISANYKFLVHAHSHVALLGWIYTGLTTLIYTLYLKDADITPLYKRIFWGTQITIVGMLFTFPFMGYKALSIVFSTLFLIASYFFAWLVFKHTSKDLKQMYSYKFMRMALWFMIISSIGPWALGTIMSTHGSASSLYKNAIYFYLHFQYNGWFLVAILGGFIRVLELQHIKISKREFLGLYWLFNCGVIATFLISILWMSPSTTIHSIAGIGSILQLIAFTCFIKKLKSIQFESSQYLLHLFIAFFLIKLVLQLLGCIPYFSSIISFNVDVVIGYIHWVFLGVVSIGLLGLLNHFKLIQITKPIIVLYTIGVLLTEVLLFYKGTSIWLELEHTSNYYQYLAGASLIVFFSILYLFLLQFKRK